MRINDFFNIKLRVRTQLYLTSKEPTQTYAQVVKRQNQRTDSGVFWKGMDITSEVSNKEWLDKCLVGKVSEYSYLANLQENLILEGMGTLKTNYLGDNMVLISSDEECDFEKIVEDNRAWLETVFDSITPWLEGEYPHNRVVWARCWGLPISLWNEDCLRKIASTNGMFISIDQNATSRINLEYVRVQMRTTIGHKIDFIQEVRINGIIYHVVIREEVNQESPCLCRCGNVNSSVTNSLSIRDPMEELSSQSECSEQMGRIVANEKPKSEDATVISPENTVEQPSVNIPVGAVGDGDKKRSLSTSRLVGSTNMAKEKAIVAYRAGSDCVNEESFFQRNLLSQKKVSENPSLPTWHQANTSSVKNANN